MIVTCPICGRRGSLQRHYGRINERGLRYHVQHRIGNRVRLFCEVPPKLALALLAAATSATDHNARRVGLLG